MSVIYCVVDPSGRVWASTESYTEAAAAAGVDEDLCARCRFDLATRQLKVDRGGPTAEPAVRAYLEEHFGTTEKVIRLALDGRLPKLALADLLAADTRRAYLDACARIERHLTEACIAAGDPCLSVPRCEMGEEICLQPLLEAGADYHKACAAEWLKLFADPRNRVPAWARQDDKQGVGAKGPRT
ncbi:MAG TPA: hypothetical protein VNI83_13710 [Vicinamibacterales bacterium]|nr:hypothetical protein [Vicinamibacterales bacterium]